MAGQDDKNKILQDPEYRDKVLEAKQKKSEPRIAGDQVYLRVSDTESPLVTVDDVHTAEDGTRTYRMKYSNGTLYNNGEYVAQDRLEDAD